MASPPLVFVHGGSHAGDCWQPTITALEAREPEIAALAVDLPGRRAVPGDLATLTIEQCVDSVVAQNGDIVSHAVTPAGHYLEITRKAGNQGLPATDGLEIIDITAQYPQFTVQP